MSDYLPDEPVSPKTFAFEVVPGLFAAAPPDPHDGAVDFCVSLVLDGPEGGAWTFRVTGGQLDVSDGRAEGSDLTVRGSVADWRATLWEGRPPLIASGVERLRREGPGAAQPPAPAELGADFDPRKGIADLRGRIDLVVESGEAEVPEWRIAVQVGDGPLADEAQATIQIGAAEAAAIESGELHPLEALITGQLRLDGDLGLILQLQAIAMNLSAATRQGPSR